jgi:hypothetical protein
MGLEDSEKTSRVDLERANRLKDFFQSRKLNKNRAAVKMGTSSMNIDNALKGVDSYVSFYKKLKKTFPHINLNWIIAGELPVTIDKGEELPAEKVQEPISKYVPTLDMANQKIEHLERLLQEKEIQLHEKERMINLLETMLKK